MRSFQMDKGIIVQLPPTTVDTVDIGSGKKVKVFRLNGVYIEYGEGENNKVKVGATGTSTTEDSAWQQVVDEIKRTLAKG
jgi:hypothetical protein